MKLSYLKKPLAAMLAFTMTLSMNTMPAFAADGTDSTEYKYVYAGLTWDEYWENEGVYLSGTDWIASSAELDAKGETDKGAYDAVTRASTNHGLHRGSFQCTAIIYDDAGNSFHVSHWDSDDSSKLYLNSSDAAKYGVGYITFKKGSISYTSSTGTEQTTMTSYQVTGIKYVPVKIKASDYDDFIKQYEVATNGTSLQGGYSEQQLVSYTEKALITDETNGLKTAEKEADGTFSFSKRATGSASGLEDGDAWVANASKAIKQVSPDAITVTVKEANGSYGEFLRVDLTGDGYGDLGSRMQAVRWDYYGTDENQTTPLASYGTKFAADNWMHKSNGIQLGLTDSLRCQLPEGTDGTGKWILTMYALGYEDYSFTIDVTAENIVSDEKDEIDTSKLEAAVKEAQSLKASDYTAASWADMQTELTEAQDELKAPHTQATVDEATNHLQAAIKALVKAEKPDATETPSTSQPSTEAPSTEKPSTQNTSTEKPSTQDTSTEKPSTQDTSTEKPSTQDSTTSPVAAKTKTYGAKAFSVKKAGATYKSSNKNVISVSKAGKATIKGVGKAVITVKTKTKTTKTTYIVKPGKITAKSIKAINSSSKKIKVTWTKRAGLGLTAKKAYYQIQYSTSKKFTKKTAKTITVKGSASSKTISKLKKGKTYYVRMRGYDKTNKKTGSWSTVKKVKIKK